MPPRSDSGAVRRANALRPALAGFADETLRLASASTGVWLRLLPRWLSLTLLGWVSYHGAVFIAA